MRRVAAAAVASSGPDSATSARPSASSSCSSRTRAKSRLRGGLASGGALLLASALPLAAALDNQCKNPLYETHWFGRVGAATVEGPHLDTVNSIPTVKTGLIFCPDYNSKATCCNRPFENEQLKYFEYFSTMIFPSKLARIREQWESVKDVTNTAAFDAATMVEKEQLGLAVERFNPVLHPSIHSRCMTGLLMYSAGMNCFVCRPDWFEYVTVTHSAQVIRVNVHPSVCMELWSMCEVFGKAAMALKQALLDSVLAKQAKLQAENLNMFEDQQALCNWLHEEVALHPFRRPSEAEREAAQRSGTVKMDGSSERRLGSPDFGQGAWREAANATARRLQESLEVHELDVLKEGRRSRFEYVWHNTMFEDGSVRFSARPVLFATAASLASLLAGAGSAWQ